MIEMSVERWDDLIDQQWAKGDIVLIGGYQYKVESVLPTTNQIRYELERVR
jgi:hypothetical protein